MQIVYENVMESNMFRYSYMGNIFLKTLLFPEKTHRITDLPKQQKYVEDCVL